MKKLTYVGDIVDPILLGISCPCKRLQTSPYMRSSGELEPCVCLSAYHSRLLSSSSSFHSSFLHFYQHTSHPSSYHHKRICLQTSLISRSALLFQAFIVASTDLLSQVTLFLELALILPDCFT